MSTHGFDPDARHAVTREDVPYLRHGDVELLARVWRPEAPGDGRVAVVDVHGGAWCDNDRRLGKRYDAALAARGAVVVAVDFRCGATGPHPRGSVDVSSAIRWVRANADALGVDPELVVSIGSSSGGHLAWLSALGCGHFEPVEVGELLVDGQWVAVEGGDDAPLGVAALWPPVDPLARYDYARNLDTDHGRRLVANTEDYFGTTRAMEEASIADIVGSGQHLRTPDVLLVVPEVDLNVPVEITDRVAAVYEAAGGVVEVRHYQGVGHGFGHFDNDQTERFDADVAEWIARIVAQVDGTGEGVA